MPLLEVQKVSKNFGGLLALNEVDVQVEGGRIHAIIGPNGAGKSTLLNVVAGTIRQSSGKVIFNGEDISSLRADIRVKKGIAKTFQANVLLGKKTVLENIMLGFHTQTQENIWASFINSPKARKAVAETENRALKLARFMGLGGWENKLAKDLPHGLQRILGVAIAVATKPRLLMLDEPLTGMNPIETLAMMRLIQQIREGGVTIILVEHNMKAVMDISDRITVLNYGQKIAEGSPDEIKRNRDVIEAYLGKGN